MILIEFHRFRINSSWGFFGQSGLDHSTATVVDDPGHYFNILNDQLHKITDIFATERQALLVYKKQGRDRSSCKKSNVPLAACVTASARVYLYREALAKIKNPKDILYTDTGPKLKDHS